MWDETPELFMLEITDALGDVLDGVDEELNKRWWWKILWSILLYGPFIAVINASLDAWANDVRIGLEKGSAIHLI